MNKGFRTVCKNTGQVTSSPSYRHQASNTNGPETFHSVPSRLKDRTAKKTGWSRHGHPCDTLSVTSRRVPSRLKTRAAVKMRFFERILNRAQGKRELTPLEEWEITSRASHVKPKTIRNYTGYIAVVGAVVLVLIGSYPPIYWRPDDPYKPPGPPPHRPFCECQRCNDPKPRKPHAED